MLAAQRIARGGLNYFIEDNKMVSLTEISVLFAYDGKDRGLHDSR